MSTGHNVTISPTDDRVEVRLGEQLLADSTSALRLEETGYPARYYIPKSDIRMDALTATSFHTTCPFKGEASYWSATIDGEVHDGIVWAYEQPIGAAGDIAGLLSFDTARSDVTVNGQIVD